MSMPTKWHFVSGDISDIKKYKEKIKKLNSQSKFCQTLGLIFSPMAMNI